MAKLVLKNYSFGYAPGQFRLSDINLAAAGGERIGIVGASGAGKTTLLLNLVGILAGRGSILIDGEECSGNGERLLEKIGLVLQNPDDQLFCATVFEELSFGLRRKRLPESEIRNAVRDFAARFGIGTLLDSSAFRLSFGQKKKVTLASVMIMDPEIIALDEPFAGLDYSAVMMLVRILEKIPKTQILVSQDILLTAAYCDRIVFLKNGEIEAVHDSRELLQNRELLHEIDIDFKEYGSYLRQFWGSLC